jgi:hypothetical protein
MKVGSSSSESKQAIRLIRSIMSFDVKCAMLVEREFECSGIDEWAPDDVMVAVKEETDGTAVDETSESAVQSRPRL